MIGCLVLIRRSVTKELVWEAEGKGSNKYLASLIGRTSLDYAQLIPTTRFLSFRHAGFGTPANAIILYMSVFCTIPANLYDKSHNELGGNLVYEEAT